MLTIAAHVCGLSLCRHHPECSVHTLLAGLAEDLGHSKRQGLLRPLADGRDSEDF